MSYTPPAGNNVELILGEAAATDNELIFGASFVNDPIEVAVAGTLDDLVAVTPVVLLPPILVALAGALEDLGGAMAVNYDSDVQRPIVGGASTSWQTADDLRASVSVPLLTPESTRNALATRWTPADALPGSPFRVPLPTDLVRARTIARSAYENAQHLPPTRAGGTWQSAQSTRRLVRSAYENAQQRQGTSTRSVFQNALHDRRPHARTTWQPGRGMQVVLRTTAGQGLQLEFPSVSAYQNAMRPPPGRSTWGPVTPPFDPCYLPPAGDEVELVFSGGAATDNELIFVCERHDGPPGATVVVPVRKVYSVINTFTLFAGAQALHPLSAGMSLDVDSWTWSFNATLRIDDLPHVKAAAGERAQILATVNGVEYAFLVEGVSSDRSFPKERISISARGINAALDLLSGTYDNASADRTAVQLMGDVLTVNGVGIGWDVDSSLEDWLVPAGAWAFTGTAVAALQAIAGAAGGYLQPHPTEQTVIVLPRYPLAPWDWGTVTPDYELPSDPVTTEGITYVENPRYDVVMVTGQGKGVTARVVRTGEDGDVPAPMVTDALITAAAAARQRGLSVLGAAGSIENVSLTLPVLPEIGIIPPGKFIRYVDGAVTRIGITRSVSVQLGMSKHRQTVEIETHA